MATGAAKEFLDGHAAFAGRLDRSSDNRPSAVATCSRDLSAKTTSPGWPLHAASAATETRSRISRTLRRRPLPRGERPGPGLQSPDLTGDLPRGSGPVDFAVGLFQPRGLGGRLRVLTHAQR